MRTKSFKSLLEKRSIDLSESVAYRFMRIFDTNDDELQCIEFDDE